MSDQVLDRLRYDHDNLRSLCEVFAGQVAIVAREEEPDYGLMRDLIANLLDDPERYHHPFEQYLSERLVARRPSASGLVDELKRRQRRLSRLGRRVQRRLGEIAIDVPVRRRRFVALAQAYLRLHERQLAREEGEWFPLLAATLDPVDWLEATTALHWYLSPAYSGPEAAPLRHLRDHIGTVFGASLPPTASGFCPLCAVD